MHGVDALTPYYNVAQKEANLAEVEAAGVACVRADLRSADLIRLLADTDVVFHQAAQPGVRASWSEGFEAYAQHNIVATQRLLEAARTAAVRRVVYASSSSVYGQSERYPTAESDLPRPYSPYGVTKLAAEHLCSAYAQNFGLSVVSLRYFTVYGARQRPDMAIHRLVESALHQRPFPLYGDGQQVREFTHVADVVRANIAAATADLPGGAVVNISGGSQVSLRDVIAKVGDIVGTPVVLDLRHTQPGDVRRTGGSSEQARRLLGWKPEIELDEGLADQVRWHRSRRAADGD